MIRCEAHLSRTNRQCRRPAEPGRTTCAQHRPATRSPVGTGGDGPAREAARPAAEQDAFYTTALAAAERYDLAAAASVSGIDGEIAVLRLVIRRELQANPEDGARLLRAVEALTRAVRVKYQLSEKRRENLAEAMAAVLEELGAAAGLDAEG